MIVRVLVFTPMAPDGILPFCLSQLYDIAPSASQVSDKLRLLVDNLIRRLDGCVVKEGKEQLQPL